MAVMTDKKAARLVKEITEQNKIDAIAKSNKPTLKQIPNTNDTEAASTVKPVWVENYLSLNDFKYHPATQLFFERMAQEFMDWGDKEDSLVVAEFYTNKKIPSSTFDAWFDKYQPMKRAHEYVKQKISTRKEMGAMTRRYDSSFTKESMYVHSTEWREFLKFKKDLELKALESQKIEIFLPDITKKPCCHKEQVHNQLEENNEE
jgi:hypothetical protein